MAIRDKILELTGPEGTDTLITVKSNKIETILTVINTAKDLSVCFVLYKFSLDELMKVFQWLIAYESEGSYVQNDSYNRSEIGFKVDPENETPLVWLTVSHNGAYEVFKFYGCIELDKLKELADWLIKNVK